MPQTGFEPVHGYPYNDLNVARLPVPPLGHLKYLIKAECQCPRQDSNLYMVTHTTT